MQITILHHIKLSPETDLPVLCLNLLYSRFLSQILSVGEVKRAYLCRTRVINIRGDQEIMFHVIWNVTGQSGLLSVTSTHKISMKDCKNRVLAMKQNLMMWSVYKSEYINEVWVSSSVKLCGTLSYDDGVTQIHVFTNVTLCWMVTVQDCMTLKIKELRSFRMLVMFYQSTQTFTCNLFTLNSINLIFLNK
jgi:hypothetical protein